MALAIGLIGGGTWGTTLMGLFQQTGHRVELWRRSSGIAALEPLQNCDLVVSAVAFGWRF
ncbi:MAG: glycerol-3-phosphate dehydrogenase, partial [Synechococcaceae bacterium WB8_3_299]|nr:glycerol-3-phosphate dehydrogenase [Synechococcaceae bacterium WB8_3_299]